jgi:hypothetical protein
VVNGQVVRVLNLQIATSTDISIALDDLPTDMPPIGSHIELLILLLLPINSFNGVAKAFRIRIIRKLKCGRDDRISQRPEVWEDSHFSSSPPQFQKHIVYRFDADRRD